MFGITPYNRRNLDVQRAKNIFDVESLFDSFFNDSISPSLNGFGSQMKVDIKENEKDYVIEAEMPGVNKDEINIEMRDDRLTIAVQKNEDSEEERDNYIRKERRTSSMSRSFYVADVKPEEIKAKFENGVLSITLPKSEGQKKQHKIDIN
jgi:HSP20 family protein